MQVIRALQTTEEGFVVRASNAYYKGATGVLQVAGPNVTRFRYKADGSFAGFLLEPNPHTSVIAQSEVFTDATMWEKTNITIGAAGVGPDGGATSGTLMTATGTGRIEYAEKSMGATAFTLTTGSPTAMAHIEVTAASISGPAPFVQAVGATGAGSGTNFAVSWPAHQADDIGLLIVETSGSPNPPTGFTLLLSVASGGSSASKMLVYWRRATGSSMPAAAVGPYVDHAIAAIFTVRGADPSSNPFSQFVTSTSGTTAATKSITGLTANKKRSLMLMCATYGNDLASNPTTAWSNADTGAITVHIDGVGTALGDGGGLILASAGFNSRGYISGLTESLMRSSVFVEPSVGNTFVKLFNSVDADYAEFNLSTNTVVSGDGFIELYANGWRRLSMTHDTGFLPSAMGFGLEFDGAIYVFGANLIPGLKDVQYLYNKVTMVGDAVTGSTDVNLIYSNIPEPDPNFPPEASATMWDAGAAPYAKGATVIHKHTRYVSLVDNNSDDPEVGQYKEVPSWSNAGGSNHWRMFDFNRGVDFKSEQAGLIELLLSIPATARSFALFGVEANMVEVEAYYEDGTVYDQEFSMINISAIANWYDYFSVVPTTSSTLVRFDLPPIPGLQVKVRLTQDGMVRLGKIVFGTAVQLGCAAWGFSSQLLNYSTQTRDAFGELVLVPRRVIRTRDFKLKYNTELAEHVENTIMELVNQPTAFIGSDSLPTSIVFGIIKEFIPVVEGKRQTTASLRLEEV